VPESPDFKYQMISLAGRLGPQTHSVEMTVGWFPNNIKNSFIFFNPDIINVNYISGFLPLTILPKFKRPVAGFDGDVKGGNDGNEGNYG